MIKNKGNPDFMFTKKCDLKKINYKQKVKLTYGIKKYIKWEKKINLGILFPDDDVWTGGKNYFLSLITSLKHLKLNQTPFYYYFFK